MLNVILHDVLSFRLHHLALQEAVKLAIKFGDSQDM